MIEFLCPNGHRIHCPEEQAGRAARCPRCGVKFRIPDAAEAQVARGAGADSDISRPQLSDSGLGIGEVAPAARAQESQIEFLCPNGHRLHGPPSLQGQPGECPECGSKFRVPNYDDVSDHEEVLEEIQQEISLDASAGGGSALALPHPLAGLFAKLWAQKPSGAAVELHLGDGETLVPDRFAKALSRQNHGVFAVKEPGGTHTLTVVAWDSIVRVLVRGVKQLPREMRE